ncbi:MAG: P-II family nitrogen regulator [Desulfitobacteriia bacterium]|jgi:nitrogen regulatory protein P-II 1
MSMTKDAKLIVSVVAREKTEIILDAIEKEGAKKSTVLLGRSISADSPTLLFNLKIEPQREVIFTLVSKQNANRIFETILESGELNTPHNGTVFILDVEKIGGSG